MNEFDGKAATWDMNPVHWERSKVIAELLIKATEKNGKQMKALDFGAGSGILSFMLREHLKEITLVDGSEGMINVIKNKIADGGITNLKPVHIDIEKESFNGGYDLIFSQMVFHHIEDIDGVLKKLHSFLNSGGMIAIADLYPEDGSFHGEEFTGHLGFDPEELAARLSNSGFINISHQECFVMKKVLENGENKEYPIFLLLAYK
jgi:tRNA (cmo5U34)-methyltransferase